MNWLFDTDTCIYLMTEREPLRLVGGLKLPYQCAG